MLFILQMFGTADSLGGMHDSDTKKGQDIKASLSRSPLYGEYCWRCPRADHPPLRPSHGHVVPLRRRIFWRFHHRFASSPSVGFVAWAPVYSVSRGPRFIEKQPKSRFPPTRCRQPPTSRRYAQSYPVAI